MLSLFSELGPIGLGPIGEIKRIPTTLSSPESGRGWRNIIRESYAGAWQQNVEVSLYDVLSHPIVFACLTLIASDMAKMGIKLVQLDERTGIWSEVENPAFSPFLRKPNHYQTRIEFIESWMISKLGWGNAYVLKQRDNRQIVTAGYVLDPNRVRPLVAPDGGVYYQLMRDDLSEQHEDGLVVPASEVFHNRTNTLYHPLVGMPPIYASGLAATMGIKIINNSAKLFTNGSNPGGVLTAPGKISQETADRLKAHWDANYTGDNVGKVAVLGDGLKFEKMSVTAVESQLVEQGDWVSQAICSTFHVPPYMVGVGTAPTYNNIEALNQQYYSQCLQIHIESLELCLDEGLGLAPWKTGGQRLGTEMDLDNLLRMDTATMVTTLKEGVGAGIFAPNEARKRLNLPPAIGGDSPMAQQQQFSLQALAERDQNKPFAKPATPPPATPADAPMTPPKGWISEGEDDVVDVAMESRDLLMKELAAA